MSINDHKNKLKGFNFNKYAHTDLTNYSWVKLLHFILKSKEPLTSYEIQCGMGESKYVLEMLNNLYTPSSKLQPLFTWEKVGSNNYDNNIIENKNIKKKLYRLLNTIYKLDWFDEKNDQYDHLVLAKHGKIITLSYGKTKKLEIRLAENKNVEENKKEGQAIVKIHDDKIRHAYFLNTIRKKSGLHVYVETYYNPKTLCRYLDVEYGPEVNRLVKKAKKLYSGNFRGFLLYLTCEYKHGWSQTGKKRIHEVISNSSLTKKIPFLKYWKDFEGVGFDVLDVLKEIVIDFNNIITKHYRNYSHDYNTYEDDHSRIIGMNARDTSDDNIKLILTERCHKAVLDHFADFECPTILSPIIYSKEYADYTNLKIADKVKVYNLEMLEIQRKLLIQRLNRMDEAINVGDPIYPVPFL